MEKPAQQQVRVPQQKLCRIRKLLFCRKERHLCRKFCRFQFACFEGWEQNVLLRKRVAEKMWQLPTRILRGALDSGANVEMSLKN